jgi:chorismate synthase
VGSIYHPGTPMEGLEIRPLQSHKEFRQCEQIQKTVWGTLGVSSEAMIVTQKYGGLVLGGFVGGRMAGFIYAFLGRRNDRLIHWSHMMAVMPGCRDRKLGLRMKLAHRRLALSHGIKSIGWTFDPMQSRNAALNIHRLGAQVEEYVRDCYGNFPSRIERGLPSDRFVVNWRIASPAVERRLRQGPPASQALSFPRVNEVRLNPRGLLENRKISLGLRTPKLLVEIPANTDEIRSRSIALALRWRKEVRKIFERYFSSGYQVEDFVPLKSGRKLRCFYVLRRPRAGK